MTAGLNLRCNIWRISYDPDDEVGGAVITGSVLHESMLLNLQEEPAEQLLLQQGLETQKIFTGTVVPGNKDIRERDELEVTFPYPHVFYGKRFRILNVRHSSFAPTNPRDYTLLTMVRSVEAHSLQ